MPRIFDNIDLNQAYSLITVVYEPRRRAHVGNVSAKALCWDTARRIKNPQPVRSQPFRDWMYDREQPGLFA